MKQDILVLVGLVTLCMLPGCGSYSGLNSREGIFARRQVVTNLGSVSHNRTDTLEWLVGKWRCVERRSMSESAKTGGSHGENHLEYLNVYLPYADENLTLNLTANPDDRPIAAEFLVREEDHPPFSQEGLVQMYPHGLVRIGTDRIWIAGPFDLFEFRYSFDQRAFGRPCLELQSKDMYIKLQKVSDDPGDLKQSRVYAPVIGYSDYKLEQLRHKYEVMKSSEP